MWTKRSRQVVGRVPASDERTGCIVVCHDPQTTWVLDGSDWSGPVTVIEEAGATAYLLPTSGLARAWMIADESAKGENDSVSGIGVAAGDEEDVAGLVRRARRSARLAQTRHVDGGAPVVCTWEMVVLERLAAWSARGRGTAYDRHERLLRMIERGLGPTQREHLVEHSRRVGQLAAMIEAELGGTLADVELADQVGRLHDLGKAVIPEELLGKPGPLTPRERAIMDRHAEEGARLVECLGAGERVSVAIRHHHDRFEGGRDRRLPRAARIVCVADAAVTIMSDRPYRARRSPAHAAAELAEHQGGQFDPDVVYAALKVLTRTVARAAA